MIYRPTPTTYSDRPFTFSDHSQPGLLTEGVSMWSLTVVYGNSYCCLWDLLLLSMGSVPVVYVTGLIYGYVVIFTMTDSSFLIALCFLVSMSRDISSLPPLLWVADTSSSDGKLCRLQKKHINISHKYNIIYIYIYISWLNSTWDIRKYSNVNQKRTLLWTEQEKQKLERLKLEQWAVWSWVRAELELSQSWDRAEGLVACDDI